MTVVQPSPQNYLDAFQQLNYPAPQFNDAATLAAWHYLRTLPPEQLNGCMVWAQSAVSSQPQPAPQPQPQPQPAPQPQAPQIGPNGAVAQPDGVYWYGQTSSGVGLSTNPNIPGPPAPSAPAAAPSAPPAPSAPAQQAYPPPLANPGYTPLPPVGGAVGVNPPDAQPADLNLDTPEETKKKGRGKAKKTVEAEAAQSAQASLPGVDGNNDLTLTRIASALERIALVLEQKG